MARPKTGTTKGWKNMKTIMMDKPETTRRPEQIDPRNTILYQSTPTRSGDRDEH